MAVVIPSSENRYDRFIYLRTANMMCIELEQFEEALQIARLIYDLSDEDPNWESAFEMRIESYISKIKIWGKQQNVSEIRCIGDGASAELEAYQSQNIDLDFEQQRKLSTLYHNLAASLYFVHQYDLAIPLFRSAINLGIWQHWAYSWLAASLWATTQSRDEVLPILRQGADRIVGDYKDWMGLPEFQDVVTDAEFLAAAKRRVD